MKIVGPGWTSPFSPIFPRELSPMQPPPPPLALLPMRTMFFDLFSRASKISHTFPHFPPFPRISPRELSLMHPRHSLVANQNHVF